MRPFFVYMLRCGDGSFYVGHTDDLERRLEQHWDGCPGYTRKRHPLELVFKHETETRVEALEIERKLKGWSRAKKQALIRGDFETIRRLSKGQDAHVRRRAAGPSLRAAYGRAPLRANGGEGAKS